MRKIITYKLISFAIVCCCMLQSHVLKAQWLLDLAGTVKKEETKKRMAGATITIKRNGSLFKTITPEDNGRFEAELPSDAIYIVEFSKPGHITKRIEINTRNVPPDDATYGLDFAGFEVSLFEEIDGLDVSILNQPIAKIAFDPEIGYMNYDAKYTKSIKKELERLKEELAERLKQLEAERKAKQKDYDAAISAGDKAFNVEKWAEAKPHYDKAAAIFPKETYPPEQLAEIKAQLDKNAAADKAYTEAIAKADKAFTDRDWENATSAYQSALTIKEDEQYPKDKLKEIETIVANEEKVNQEYNEAIASADGAFSDKDFDKAKENYTKAAGLKSYEQYPKDKLKEIDDILADLAQKEKGYNDAIAEADNQFNGKEYGKAIENYNKALGFKPEEEYPRDKIVKAKELLAGLKQLKEDYDKFIADGDGALSSKDYDAAKSNYQEALDLFSNEQYPKDKLAEIESIVAAAEKLEADYNAAIVVGDKAFGKEQYEASITAFEKATALKPDEQYPKDKLEEIKALMEELAAKKAEEEAAMLAQKEIDDKYNAFVQSGDNSFTSKDYANAVQNYESAIEVKSEEQYPKDKLEEIEEILAELERKKEEDAASALAQKELDAKYNEFITAADKAFNDKSYDDATENYTEATDVKPEEQYPKDKIKEIEDLLAALEKKKEEDELAAESERKKREYYEALIAEADGELTSENYTEAKEKYNQALGVISGEQYPKDKIKEIEDILAKIEADKANANLAQKQLDDKYNKLIIEADNAFGSEDYEKAKIKYKAALNVKNEEDYPQDQINKINELLDEIARKETEIMLTNNALKQKQEQYEAFVKLADSDFAGKRYEKAISNYEQALGIMPDKVYPNEKIDEIRKILADIAEKEKNDKDAASAEKEKRASYEKLVYDGDRAMKTKSYKDAQGKFNAALSLYPDEKYPSDKLAEILELLNTKTEEPILEITNNTSGARAKIDNSKEKEIEERMAKLLGKVNSDKAKALDADKNRYENQEEIRISGGITRTKEAEDQLDRYADDIAVQTERGNKFHIENNESLLATTSLLEKAENTRIKNADKRREKSDEELAVYVKEQIAFKKEQDELSKDKMINHNVYVDDVTETKLVMIERGDKIREENRKTTEKLIDDTEKNKERAKNRREELELDVHKYKSELASKEEIMISASIDRTDKNEKDLEKLANEMTKMNVEKTDYYKLNVDELTKFKARIDKFENQRINKAGKYRAANKKANEKIEADFIKNTARQEKRYRKDIKQVGKFKKVVEKQEASNQKKADKKIRKSDKDIVAAKTILGVSTKSQEKRYKDFKVKLDEERVRNNDFVSDLQTMEKEKRLLANAELDNFYMGEKQPRQDSELAKKYPQGITEETSESGNSITISRIKVTGDQADVYERVFYTWGGTFFYKNGVNITQSLWDKESIE